MGEQIVGRDAELHAIDQLLHDVAGGPAALVLSGEAGIGKSTLWTAGVEAARNRGFTILSCRPAAAEVRLSYAGLGDLVADVGSEFFEPLPVPQRQAIDAALLRGPGDTGLPEPRAVAAGFLSVVGGLAAKSPVLIAIDDIQWLDEPSLLVVQFACRRFDGPIAMLAAERVTDAAEGTIEIGPPAPDRRSSRHVGPLSLAALHQVLKKRIGKVLPRHTIVDIAERSAGNAFYALELARSLDAAAGNVERVPRTLQSALRGRFEALAPSTIAALCAVSALANPRLDLIERVLDADVRARLGPAEDAGVITIGGGVVRFTHPLLATAVYNELPPTSRRTLHRRLSAIVEDVEERARHLALATVSGDAETITALDSAADNARRRGAPGAAAELLERAITLGAADPSRLVRAAEDHYRTGNRQRAGELLEEVASKLGPGPLRARALARLGLLDFRNHELSAATRRLKQAVEEAADDPALRAAATLDLCRVLFSSGGIRESQAVVAPTVDDAERSEEPGLVAEALAVRALVAFLLGDGTDDVALSRALALEDGARPTPVASQPSMVAGRIYCQLHRLDEARAAFETVRQRCIDHGAETDLWLMEFWVLRTACETGEIEAAEQLADEYRERSAIAETPHWVAYARLAEARVHAWVGRVDAARRAVEEALAHYPDDLSATFRLFAAEALSMAELSADNFEAAAALPLPALHEVIAEGFNEPAAFQMVPDVVEALVMLDRSAEAVPLIEWLQVSGAKPDRPWAEAVGARCRALLLAAQGNADAADEAFTRAFAAHERVPQARYDRGRTLLAAGRAARRRGRRRVAQEQLADAVRLFDEIGMARWARNARAELGRLGLQPGAGDELTAAEHRIAELAASGMTNREIAAAVFVSAKTVEAHLGRVYRKLGVRNRAELGRRMAGST